MNNSDKINILRDAIKHYYNTQLCETAKLDLNEASKILRQYEEVRAWIEYITDDLE